MWKEVVVLLLGVAGLVFSELGSFVWSIRKCALIKPDFSGQEVDEQHSTLLFLAVSDLHVLGRRRSSLDLKWTSYQLRKTLYLLSKLIQPDVVLSLGDHLDQGGYASDEEWTEYVRSYRWATSDLSKQILVLDSIIGNHDAEFANKGMTPLMLQRFQKEFGSANGVLHIGDVEVVWVNSLALDENGRTEAHEEVERLLARLQLAPAGDQISDEDGKPRFRILLSHVPLYRLNDLECGKTRLREGAHITYVAPSDTLSEGSDVLSQNSSQRLIDIVKPNLILAGHLHTQCYRQVLSVVEESDTGMAMLEMTVPTLSYRMRPDPGFSVFMVHLGRVQGKTCKLPHEQSIIVMDVVSALVCAIGALGALWRVRAERKNKAE